MNEIHTPRLLLRPFRETDYDDLYEFLSQLRDDEFEGYPGITRENGRKHLTESLGFRREALLRQNLFFRRDESGAPVWKDTCVYALLESDERKDPFPEVEP